MILPPEHGMVCLTFDDGRYTEWLAQLSLFAEYDAHATFFYNGIPDCAPQDMPSGFIRFIIRMPTA